MDGLLREVYRNLMKNIRNGELSSLDDLWFDEDDNAIVVQYRDNEYRLIMEKN
jgi:hypothetical protein